MILASPNNGSPKTTSYRVVLPFYVYAAISFLAATLVLLFSTPAFLGNYFHPKILAITHIMTLGWGTMIILGASHQLVPVLIEGKLYSNKLAYTSFIFAAIGIPFLTYGFYVFDMGLPAQLGGCLVLLSVLFYLLNLGLSILKSKKENIHALFIFTSVVWLFVTAFLGLSMVYNFNSDVLSRDSLHYLPLHVHTGIVGWFLLLIIGVGSRLIPMFLISKYTNTRLLNLVYLLINGALLVYILIFYFEIKSVWVIVPAAGLLTAIVLFIYYCYSAFKQRIRKQVDAQIKLSLLSVVLIIIPIVVLISIIVLFPGSSLQNNRLILCYGFLVLFGWLTAIILGMTFKTLPFIIWNKVYHHSSGKTPNPKDLFNTTLFTITSLSYLSGLLIFVAGIMAGQLTLLKCGATLLVTASVFYVVNVYKLVSHKPDPL